MVFRSLFFIFILCPFIIVGLPLQLLILLLRLPFWNALPRLFHRLACVFLGLRVSVEGTPVQDRPTLLLSNHVSWTDIVAIGSVADVTFVAKREISKWPVVGVFAAMQRTIFVDRTRKRDARRTTREMGKRMAGGGAVLLFAEGQSDIGTHVLPFRSALVGAAQHAMEEAGATGVVVQPLTVAYTRLQGLSVSMRERAFIAWIKSKSVKQNIGEILSGGVKRVTVAFGTPIPLAAGADRKVVTKLAEDAVRRKLVELNRGQPAPIVAGATVPPTAPQPAE